MRKESYLSLLILCSVLWQGNAVISNEKIEKSSDIHVRNKRVINHSQEEVHPENIRLSRHLVQILVADTFECAGSIIQPNIILTIRLCLYGSDDQYTVLSGSLIKNRGTRHHVLKTKKHPSNNLALLNIHPPIILGSGGNNKIQLFTGHLPPNPSGLFSGWGCTNISPSGERTYPNHLMSAFLPIITYEQCLSALEAAHGLHPLRENICTLDRHKQKGACFGDEGGSLVIEGRLLGIYSHSRGVNLGVNPDIFINLNIPIFAQWVQLNTRELLKHHITTLNSQFTQNVMH